MSGPEKFGGFFHFFGKGDFKGLVLHLLEERPMHGYEIIKAIEERYHGFYKPSAGAIYPALRALLRKGYLSVSGGVPDHPGGQGVSPEPPQGDRGALSRVRVRGRSGASRAVPRIPGDGEAPPHEHERGHPEAGERTSPDCDRDARESDANPLEVIEVLHAE